jgi:adenylate cyclase
MTRVPTAPPWQRLFADLKRRRVFRVLTVYGVVGFVVLQAADLLVPVLLLPEWTYRLMGLALLAGFPVAIALAWAFDLTGEGVRRTDPADAGELARIAAAPRRQRWPAGVMALAASTLLLGGAWLALGGGGPGGDPAPGASSPSPGGVPSLAVIPFADLAADPDDAWFADGLTEEVLNRLARTPGLKVAGRTSSFQFKGHDEDLRVVGARLGVGHILEGSVRRAGGRLRITAQLVSVADGFHLWSDSFDRQLDDVFAIQDDIARAIVDALRLELDATPAMGAPTANLAAYERLLEARTLIARRGGQSLQRAIVLLDEAVRLDPAFAPAWGALAQAHSLVYWYDVDVPRTTALTRAEAAAQRALQLDPELASAHQVLGDVLRDRYRWLEAEASYRRALALSPNDVEANSQYGQMLTRLGLFGAAIPFVGRAAELDPLAAVAPSVLGVLLHTTGDAAAGMALVRRARGLAPDLIWLPMMELMMLLDRGHADAALDVQRRISDWLQVRHPGDPVADLYRQLVKHRDHPTEVLAFLRRSAGYPAPHAGSVGWSWAVYLGDPAVALELMNGEHHGDGAFDASFSWFPGLAPARRLAGFADLAAAMNMPDYWRVHGWPPDCRPLDGDAFECGLEGGP